jgi:DNA-binding transcriptional MerR regulator
MDTISYLLSSSTPMKISELSQLANVPVATIKYYIREGLLPAGERTARNQADYGARHVSRLALIRSLRDAAGLPLETIAQSLRAADGAERDFVVAAIDALERPERVPVDTASPEYAKARRIVLSLAEQQGWQLDESDVSVRDASKALTLITAGFADEPEEVLRVYAEVAERLALVEIPDSWLPDASPEEALRYALLGTVMFEPFILALRRMAHCARSRKLRTPAPSKRGKR